MICVANNTGPAAFAQYGALAALSPEGDEFRAQMRGYCRAGREIVQRFLDAQNRIRWITPDGAFYGFLQIEGLDDSVGFAKELVKTARVGVAPGSAFGPPGDKANAVRDPHLLRAEAGTAQEGLERLAKAVASL